MYRSLYPDSPSEDRNFCQAQTTALDGAVGEVVAYLKANGLWDDTLIVFSSDNGGQYNRHDNFPLRGFKNTSFEGGVRVPGFVTGGYLDDDRKGVVATDFVSSVVDWYPTLLSAAGIEPGYHRSRTLYGNGEAADSRFDDTPTVPLDGKDLWRAIQFGEVTEDIAVESRELLLDVDFTETCEFSSCGALRSGRWKFIRGAVMGVNESVTDGKQWLSDFAKCDSTEFECAEAEVAPNSLHCHLAESGCLFNLDLDACEKSDVGDQYPDIRAHLIERLDYYQSQAAPILITAGMGMTNEGFNPGDRDEKFWGPYKDYGDITFESDLETHFQEHFGEDSHSENEHMEWRPEPGHEHGEGLSAMGKTPTSGDRQIVSKMVPELLSIGFMLMLYFVGRYCLSPKDKPVDNEVAPLLVKEPVV